MPKTKKFSFVESLTGEGRDPFRDQHFQQTLNDIKDLERWMKKRKISNHWSFTEKLAFLRNVESTIRTGSAFRRTQLAWFALAIATLSTLLGFIIGLNA